ncbi:hypothetical protein [Deinococcus ruber]|uniref:hypothetical protein n=1 Tax=Deinococcus ruber TaxID=1848197 RepID=UPI00166F1CBF|nr:hypothetical protein [Deinococcus ruber]
MCGVPSGAAHRTSCGDPQIKDRAARDLAQGTIDPSFDGVVDLGCALPPPPSSDSETRVLSF